MCKTHKKLQHKILLQKILRQHKLKNKDTFLNHMQDARTSNKCLWAMDVLLFSK